MHLVTDYVKLLMTADVRGRLAFKGHLAERQLCCVQEVYDLVAVVQNSPQGIPVFLRRVNNARFDLSTPGFAKMEWLTIGLPDAGWRAFAYHNDSKSFGIHDESTIYPHDSNCDCVDRYTANLFTEKEPKR